MKYSHFRLHALWRVMNTTELITWRGHGYTKDLITWRVSDAECETLQQFFLMSVISVAYCKIMT